MEFDLAHIGTMATAVGAVVALWIRLGTLKRTHDADVERHAVREALQKEALAQHDRRIAKLEERADDADDVTAKIFKILAEIKEMIGRIDERLKNVERRVK